MPVQRASSPKVLNRNALFFLCMLAVATSSTVRAEPTSRSKEGGWKMRTFMISHWGFPKDDKQLEQFARAGFNTVIAVPAQLPACRKYGWKALLAIPADKAGAYADDPVIWGYHVFDEPARKGVRYGSFSKRIAALHKLDPVRPAYINLNEQDDPEAFVRALKPRVLSYDYYQWWSKQEPFFPLLEKYRSVALAANIPLVCWVEAVAVPSGTIPADNEAKIRHSVYSALAYGAKGIQWWAWRPYNDDAAKINAELKTLGSVLMKLRSVDVFHAAPLPKRTRGLPAKHWVQTSSEGFVLGFFKDEQDEDLILVANRDWKAARTVSLVFRGPDASVAMLDRKTGKWAARKLTHDGDQRTLTHRFPPGDGLLLRVRRP